MPHPRTLLGNFYSCQPRGIAAHGLGGRVPIGERGDPACRWTRSRADLRVRVGTPIWPTAPFAIAFSVSFFFGAVTVVSTYDRVSPSHEHELSETELPDDLRGLRVLLVEDSLAVADALKQHLGTRPDSHRGRAFVAR
jgi:hypothetical protein